VRAPQPQPPTIAPVRQTRPLIQAEAMATRKDPIKTTEETIETDRMCQVQCVTLSVKSIHSRY